VEIFGCGELYSPDLKRAIENRATREVSKNRFNEFRQISFNEDLPEFFCRYYLLFQFQLLAL